jgi:hypothetical protein
VRRRKEQLHRAVVQLLQIYQSRGLLTFCHVPNGGWRRPAEAAVLKAMGTTPGVPDLLLWAADGRSFSIERSRARANCHQRKPPGTTRCRAWVIASTSAARSTTLSGAYGRKACRQSESWR